MDRGGIGRVILVLGALLAAACEDTARGEELGPRPAAESRVERLLPRVGAPPAGGPAGAAPAATAGPTLETAKAGCDEGLLPACLDAAALLVLRGGPAAQGQARRLLERACRHGSDDGCLQLARKLAAGEGGPADLARALGLAKDACDGGAPAGCYTLGRLVEGHGAPGEDPGNAKAIALYGKACDAGLALACDELGQVYLRGRHGAPTRPDLAGSWFRRACELGRELACDKANMPASRGR